VEQLSSQQTNNFLLDTHFSSLSAFGFRTVSILFAMWTLEDSLTKHLSIRPYQGITAANLQSLHSLTLSF
jgi:hypothetical protein